MDRNDAGEIEQLAREYATTHPVALRMNYGVQRSENGGTTARAIAMLPALTGAWKYRGGGGSLSTSGAFSWNKATSSDWILLSLHRSSARHAP